MKKLMMMMMTLPLLLVAAAQAETIHGACDDLQGTAGGAYGLCVAICEVPAEDEGCTPTYIDGVLVEDSLDDCRPAAMRLVEKFQEKAPVGVELPCGDYQTSVACPCPNPDIDVSQPYSCIPRLSGGGVTQLNNGALSNFSISNIPTRGWFCRTQYSDGTRIILPVPGQEGDGTEVDACIDKYRSYCP